MPGKLKTVNRSESLTLSESTRIMVGKGSQSSEQCLNKEVSSMENGIDRQGVATAAFYLAENCGSNVDRKIQDWLVVEAEIDNRLQKLIP